MEQIGVGKRLQPGELATLAESVGLTEAHIRTVMDVETSGKGYDSLGWVEFLFEPHIFFREVNKQKLALATSKGYAYPNWRGPGSYPKTPQLRHDQFTGAYELDASAALRSASWGLGQVMGYECYEAGYDSPQKMVTAFAESEANQVKAMINLIVKRGLDRDLLRFPDIEACRHFALRYNGAGYEKNDYHHKLQAAYLKEKSRTDTLGTVVSAPQPKGDAAIKFGDTGDAVKDMQKALIAAGYKIDADGDYGNKTKTAVLMWKQLHELDATSSDMSQQDLALLKQAGGK